MATDVSSLITSAQNTAKELATESATMVDRALSAFDVCQLSQPHQPNAPIRATTSTTPKTGSQVLARRFNLSERSSSSTCSKTSTTETSPQNREMQTGADPSASPSPPQRGA